ncbi:MAG TPA: outer membrane lipoprotein chaperone LolA [Thermoanaerobaculia bacterium]
MIQFFLTASVVLLAAPSPEANPALQRAQALYADGRSHAARFVHTYTPAGFANAKKESGEIWVQSPQRLRFEYSSPEKKIFTYDGAEGRLYVPEDRQLTLQKFSEDQREKLPLLLLTDPERFSREYSVTQEQASEAGDRLILKPREARPELAWLRITVARDGTVPQLAYEDASGNRTEFQFSSWRQQKARPEGDFRITGPAGTRILEN